MAARSRALAMMANSFCYIMNKPMTAEEVYQALQEALDTLSPEEQKDFWEGLHRITNPLEHEDEN